MSHKLRLGPIAVFLTVIAAVLATLAILTFATSRADAVLAERFAAVTALRYELEEEGNRFVQAVDSGAGLPEGAEVLEDGSYHYYIEKEGYALTVDLLADEASGGTTITNWKINKLWEGDDPFEDLWLG